MVVKAGWPGLRYRPRSAGSAAGGQAKPGHDKTSLRRSNPKQLLLQRASAKCHDLRQPGLLRRMSGQTIVLSNESLTVWNKLFRSTVLLSGGEPSQTITIAMADARCAIRLSLECLCARKKREVTMAVSRRHLIKTAAKIATAPACVLIRSARDVELSLAL
jgi:hypothetical protein